MILKRLYEDYDLPIERILLKEYRRLFLTMPEMQILLALFSIFKKRKTFSVASVAKRVEFSTDEIGTLIESLLNKRFLTIMLETKDHKEREVFDLDLTFKKLEDLYLADELDKVKQAEETYMSETIKLLEQGLGRLLLPYELENMRRWYADKNYTHESIINAIKSAKDRVSIKYVEKILTQQIPKAIEIDQDVDKALDEIYKKMR
jgi:DNA replication protein